METAMNFIPGAFKAGAAAVGGAVKTGAKQVTSLAFMNVDRHNDNDLDGNTVDFEELTLIGMISRLVLCPLFVPGYILYAIFYAKGAPIADELGALEAMDYADDSASESDEENNPRTVRGRLRYFLNWILCRTAKEVVVATDPYKLSYENFLARQVAKKSQKPKLPPYIVATNVARTDQVKFPYDGVFVKNMYVRVDDVAELERALQELEKELIQEGFADKDEDLNDDWSNTPAGVTAGDSKKVLQTLLAQAKHGKALVTKGANPYAPRRAPTKEEKKEEDVPNKLKTLIAENSEETKSPTKSHKPKKAPTPDGTPLAERMNLNVATGIAVEGPRIDAAPSLITDHYKGRG